MALGIARNAQTAGWGVGPARADITGAGVMAYTMYDTPTFSFLRNTSSRSGSTEPGSFNATGLGSISGYNTARFTVLANFYLPWAGGLSDSFYGTPCQGEFKIGGAGPGNFNIITNIVGLQAMATTVWLCLVPTQHGPTPGSQQCCAVQKLPAVTPPGLAAAADPAIAVWQCTTP